jgi:hypothetical protein
VQWHIVESAWIVVSADLTVDAGGLYAGEAGRTVAAGGGHPFDADAVTWFEVGGFGAWAAGGDGASPFVAANLTCLGWVGENAPLDVGLGVRN